MSEACPHCGVALPATCDAFCPECREDLDAAPTASSLTAPVAPAQPAPFREAERRLTDHQQVAAPRQIQLRRLTGGVLMLVGGLAGMAGGLVLMWDGVQQLTGRGRAFETVSWLAVGSGLGAGALCWITGKWLAGPTPPRKEGWAEPNTAPRRGDW